MWQTLINDREQLWQLLIYASVLGLVVGVWYAAVTVWYLHRSRHRRKVEARLGLMPDSGFGGGRFGGRPGGEPNQPADGRILRLWHDGELVETIIPSKGGGGLLQRLERLRIAAGWKTPMLQILLTLALACAVCMAVVLIVFKNPILAISLVTVILLVFRVCLLNRLKKQSGLFEKQLVDALDLGGRSLKAGHPLSGAFKLMAEELEAPVGTMFAEIVEQEALGLSVQEALRQAAERSASPDMRIFAASVIIQLRSGGNLADMMERVAWVVRERMRLSRRARVLTAEAQLSKWVLLAMPVGLFAVLNVMNPKYMEPFFTHFWGKVMIIGSLVSMLVGGWVMSRMANLKY